MAVRILLSQLNSGYLTSIKNDLIVKPNVSFFEKKRKDKYKKFGGDADIVKVPINFYKETEDSLYVPYSYYQKTFGQANHYKLILYSQFNFTFKGTLREEQILPYQELIDNITARGCSNLNLHPGAGKTFLCAKASCEFRLKTLVLVNNTVLLDQWASTYKEYTNAKYCIVENKKTINADDSILICMSTRVEHIPKSILDQIGTLILDEAHTFCTPSRIDSLLSCQPLYIIAATATPTRPDGMHVIIEHLCGTERIIKKSSKPFKVFQFNTGFDIGIPKNRFGDTDWNGYVERLCSNDARNNMIINMILQNLSGNKILVLSPRVEHVLMIHDTLKSLGVKVDHMSGKKKSHMDSNVLVGTNPKIGTGYDAKSSAINFDGFPINLLIMTVSIKSEGLLEQVSGRCFRSEWPNIFVLYDDNKLGMSHMKANAKWFRSSKGEIIYVDPVAQ